LTCTVSDSAGAEYAGLQQTRQHRLLVGQWVDLSRRLVKYSTPHQQPYDPLSHALGNALDVVICWLWRLDKQRSVFATLLDIDAIQLQDMKVWIQAEV
jgi:hypothetical protein